jgi:asparagine synthase (glutamine-hydrolysing)
LIRAFLDHSDNNNDTLPDLFSCFNGSFALVVQIPDDIFCVVDRLRSIPLFYAQTDSRFIIADDANRLRDQIQPPFNEKNGAEFLVTGYVTGRETLFDGICQIQAGEYLHYSRYENHPATFFYHRFWHEDYFSDSEEDLLHRLDEVFIAVFGRLVVSVQQQGLQIVVPLSGGLDSRIVVAMLKRLGVEDVICFSYGKNGNYEAEISKKVAEALGYQWYFVEYTHDKWYQCYHSGEASAYEHYAGNLASLPHFQDFLALQELKKEGKIPEKSVFIPGHCGDFLAGTYIPLDYPKKHHYSFEDYVQEILKSHYFLWDLNNEADILPYFKKKFFDSMGKEQIHDRESYVNQVLYFVFSERVAKFIVNSVRVYEFFGYSWRIPLWDNQLMDFFSKLPLKYRLDEYLYITYGKKILFKNNLKVLQNIECSTELNESLRRSVKQRCETMINSHKILEKLWLKIYFFKRRLYTYDSEPYFGMVQKEKFLQLFSGRQTVNSFLVIDYLKTLSASFPEKLIMKKRF